MIDAHVHFWHYRAEDYAWIGSEMLPLRQDRLPEDLAACLRRQGVSAAVAVQARCDEAENTLLLDLAARHDWIAGVVGWLDLRGADVAARLDGYADAVRLKGFRHIVQDEPDPAAYWCDAAFLRGVGLLHQRGYSYDLLAHQRDLAAVADFCARADGGTLILDHLGKPEFASAAAFDDWRAQMRRLAAMPHVAVKISGLVTECGAGCTAADVRPYVHTAFELFGSDRVLFGSDWPVCTLTHDYADVCRHWRECAAVLGDAEREAAESGNARRLYRLD